VYNVQRENQPVVIVLGCESYCGDDMGPRLHPVFHTISNMSQR